MAPPPDIRLFPLRPLSNPLPMDFVSGVSILWVDTDLTANERSGILETLRKAPAGLLRLRSRKDAIVIRTLSPEAWGRYFDGRCRETPVVWQDGMLFLKRTAEGRVDTFAIRHAADLTTPVCDGKTETDKEEGEARTGVFVPFDSRIFQGALKRFSQQGLGFSAGRYLRMDVGLSQGSTEDGRSVHQLRVQATNPVFNQWFDEQVHSLELTTPIEPGVQYYLGFIGWASTQPVGIVGVASWGVDGKLGIFPNYQVRLDANLQHRVRSSDTLPSDGLAIEVTPRMESDDRRLSVGATLAVGLYPSQHFRASLSGNIIF